MATQRKEIGTTVDFSKGLEIPNLFIKGKERFTFRDDVFGVLATQESPFTIDATTRNNLLNGNLVDVQNQTWGQGMQLLYGTVSWNETAQGTGYYITDFTVAAVVKVTRDYNTGALFLIDAVRAVPWIGAVINTKIPSYRWKAWQLFTPTRPDTYIHFMDENKSPLITMSTNIFVPLPALPDATFVKNKMLSEGRIDVALETFRSKMQEKGYTVAFPGNYYGVDICFEKTPDVVDFIPITHSYKFRVYARFWWDFTSDPDLSDTEAGRLIAPAIALAIIIAVAAFATVIGSIVAYNLTHTSSSYVKYGVLRDKDGNPIIGPDGKPIIIPEESGYKEGPPDFYAWVIPIVVLIGAGVAAFAIYQLIPRRSNSEKSR